jgi:hypothetical protein
VQNELRVGSIIKDSGVVGIIVNIIEQGKWQDEIPFKFTKNYEIKYVDGNLTVMTEYTVCRLIEMGKIIVLSY